MNNTRVIKKKINRDNKSLKCIIPYQESERSCNICVLGVSILTLFIR